MEGRALTIFRFKEKFKKRAINEYKFHDFLFNTKFTRIHTKDTTEVGIHGNLSGAALLRHKGTQGSPEVY